MRREGFVKNKPGWFVRLLTLDRSTVGKFKHKDLAVTIERISPVLFLVMLSNGDIIEVDRRWMMDAKTWDQLHPEPEPTK